MPGAEAFDVVSPRSEPFFRNGMGGGTFVGDVAGSVEGD